MKKYLIFPVLALLALSLLTCNLEFPNAFEVKGTPEISLAAHFNIGNLFKENLQGMLDSLEENGMSTIPCTNTEFHTYLIYQELFEYEIEIAQGETYYPEEMSQEFQDFLDHMGDNADDLGYEYNWGDDADDMVMLDDAIELPLLDIGTEDSGNILQNFKFQGAEILLYISGTGELSDLLTVELTYGGIVETVNIKNSKPSDFAVWEAAGGYAGENAPGDKTISIDLADVPLDDNVEIAYRVFIPAGTRITTGDLSKMGVIKVEAVVWLPLVLVAGDAGAEFDLPEMFSADKDLFDREGPGSSNIILEIVENLSLSLVLDNNPFKSTTLNIISNKENPNITIPVTLGGKEKNELAFNIDDEIMERINEPENYPFCPAISLKFEPGGGLSIPRDFNINIEKFAVSAKLSIRREF